MVDLVKSHKDLSTASLWIRSELGSLLGYEDSHSSEELPWKSSKTVVTYIRGQTNQPNDKVNISVFFPMSYEVPRDLEV